MKTLLILLLALSAGRPALAGGYGPQFLPQDLPAPGAVSVTDEELLARQQERPFGGFAPEGTTRETLDARAMSEFIAIGDFTLVVPKGAVLHMPERGRASIVDAIQGELLDWLAFHIRHRAEVSTLEVTLEQASGAEPLDETKLEAARGHGRIVIAVLGGNPISVHPAPPADDVAAR